MRVQKLVLRTPCFAREKSKRSALSIAQVKFFKPGRNLVNFIAEKSSYDQKKKKKEKKAQSVNGSDCL